MSLLCFLKIRLTDRTNSSGIVEGFVCIGLVNDAIILDISDRLQERNSTAAGMFREFIALPDPFRCLKAN